MDSAWCFVQHHLMDHDLTAFVATTTYVRFTHQLNIDNHERSMLHGDCLWLHAHLPKRGRRSLPRLLHPLTRRLPAGAVALPGKSGAGDGDRTRDFLLGKEMLYH